MHLEITKQRYVNNNSMDLIVYIVYSRLSNYKMCQQK